MFVEIRDFLCKTRNTKLYVTCIINLFFFLFDKTSYFSRVQGMNCYDSYLRYGRCYSTKSSDLHLQNFSWCDRNVPKDTYPLVVALVEW